MSTKIYNAYKLKKSNIGFLFSIKQNLTKHYINDVSYILRTYSHDWFEKSDVSRSCGLSDKNFGIPICDLGSFYLMILLSEVVRKRHHNKFNFDASMVFYHCRSRLYVQFFGLEGLPSCVDYLDKLILEGSLIDFHYQNQTDRPDGVTSKQWNHRRFVWDKIAEENNSNQFSGMGFSYDFFESNKWEICRNWKQKQDSAPNGPPLWQSRREDMCVGVSWGYLNRVMYHGGSPRHFLRSARNEF